MQWSEDAAENRFRRQHPLLYKQSEIDDYKLAARDADVGYLPIKWTPGLITTSVGMAPSRFRIQLYGDH